MNRFDVRFWGVRGSLATSGREFIQVGGNTSCVEVRAGEQLIILDAGTGLFQLGRALGIPVTATFFISHYHWDHIQGFPFFRPAYDPRNTLTVYGPEDHGVGPDAALGRQMEPPNFPVTLAALRARLDFRRIRAGDEVRVGAARVCAMALNHPQRCLGYRISYAGARVVYATDTEPPAGGESDPELVAFARAADLLICDAQYTDDEYRGSDGPGHRGWGHSTVGEACRLARRAEVKRLALFHHDPTHDDRVVAQMAFNARQLFPAVVAAREGVRLSVLPGAAAPRPPVVQALPTRPPRGRVRHGGRHVGRARAR